MKPSMKRSEVEWHGGKAYAVCRDCNSLVRINKPLLGSFHFCTEDAAGP